MKRKFFLASSCLFTAAIAFYIVVSCSKIENSTPQSLQLRLKATSVSINAGGSATGSFLADQYYSGGTTYANTAAIDLSQITSNTPPAAVFNSERYGAMTYTIPGLTAGSAQTVTLYFAETYLSASGQRKFNVSINGTSVLSSFDIYATAGGKNKAIAKTFSATANSSGQVVIQFTTVTENPKVNGISVTSTGGSSTLSVSPTSLSLVAAASSTGTFTITSTLSWTVTSSQTWLAVSPASGFNNGTITVTAQQNSGTAARTATLTVAATGATSQTVTVTQSGTGGTGTCTIPAMPSYSALPTNAFLPDPFKMMDGTRITTKDQWTCRRAEIAAQAMEYEYGYYQNTPYAATTGAKSGNAIVVTVTDNGKTISFTCSITYPSTGTAPYPAIIGCGGSSLNNATFTSMGVAVINFPNNDLGQQTDVSSRGKGKFYDMYGSSHSAGALMAWAWGVGRLIDAIEKTPAANIDPTRLAVTGCSRNGKGALACGAFNERIKLTIPQESGSGGAASWRVSDWMGTTVQTLGEITGENCWFRANFNQFNSTATKLPFDHHMVEALCAPRALLVIENTTQVWLGNMSTWATGNAAHMVWEALGIPDKMGFSQIGNHNHCAFPASQQPEVTAYTQKFLIGNGTASTTIMKTDGGLTFDKAKWVNWTVPALQ